MVLCCGVDVVEWRQPCEKGRANARDATQRDGVLTIQRVARGKLARRGERARRGEEKGAARRRAQAQMRGRAARSAALYAAQDRVLAGPGTGRPPYGPTRDVRDSVVGCDVVLQSIVAMPAYQNKSFEELRLEDYQQGNKGRGGGPPPTAASPPLCKTHWRDIVEIPNLLPEQTCARVVADVQARVDSKKFTDRGVGLPTTDVYVRDLKNKSSIYRALDAGCHLVELSTGRVVDYDREEAFVITYDAASDKRNGRGLKKHKDRDKRDSPTQSNTLLITLDESTSYEGGGTRFLPGDREPLLVRPGRGGGVTFSPDIEHEGVPLSRGRRHVVAIFTETCTKKGGALKVFKAAQKRAALEVFGGRIDGSVESDRVD